MRSAKMLSIKGLWNDGKARKKSCLRKVVEGEVDGEPEVKLALGGGGSHAVWSSGGVEERNRREGGEKCVPEEQLVDHVQVT